MNRRLHQWFLDHPAWDEFLTDLTAAALMMLVVGLLLMAAGWQS